jgi:hypothetical protein
MKAYDPVVSEKVLEKHAELCDKTVKYKLLVMEYDDSQILSIKAIKSNVVEDEDTFFGKKTGKSFGRNEASPVLTEKDNPLI